MGKTTVLRIVAGQLVPSEGKRVLGHKVVVGYQAQEFAEILPQEKSVHDIIRNAAPNGVTEKEERSVLGSFGFQGEAVNKQCRVLSGGEKIRLAFARIFINPPNLLILDEPTTHLDIAAREGLQEAVQQYKGTVIIVSHDIEFIRGAATTILAMNSETGVKKYFGGYDYYREKEAEGETNFVRENPSAEQETEGKTNSKRERRRKAEQRNRLQGLKKQLEKKASKLETEIETWDEEKANLLAELTENSSGIDYARTNKRLKELDKQINSASEEWNAVADELDKLLEQYHAL